MSTLRKFQKRKEKGTESVFKAIMTEKLPKPRERNRHPDS